MGYIPNGRITRECQTSLQAQGATCKVNCSRGFALHGASDHYTCSDNGNWSPEKGTLICTGIMSVSN